jgi:hypothetical protein
MSIDQKIVLSLVVLAALFVTQSSSSAEVTIPNTFTSGTKAVAAEVNENFDAVAEAISQNQTGAGITLDPLHSRIGQSYVSVVPVASVTITVPSAGYVIVTHSGSAVTFSEPNTINLGVGDTELAMDTSVSAGSLDDTSTRRHQYTYSVSNMYLVPSAGTYTYYGLAQKNLIFNAGSVNVSPQSLIALFVPNQY